MKVSVITATYNSEATIRDTLKSVQDQSYSNIEHIIVDGLSKDKTLEIVKEFDAIKVVSEKDNGIYDAMNKGIALATGDIIAILNSDDFYATNEVIEKVVMAMKETKADTVYGDLKFVDPEKTTKVVRTWIAGDYNKECFLYGWMPPHPAFFVKSELYKKFGNFDTSFKCSADYELMLRFLFRNNVSTHYINEVFVYMRTGGQSNISIKGRIAANREDHKAWRKNNLNPKFYTTILKPIRKIEQFFRS